MIYPTIHLNGTSKGELESQYQGAEVCNNCPSPEWDGYERFRMLDLVFDIKLARDIVASNERERFEVTPEKLRGLAVPIDPEEDWKIGEDGIKRKSIHMGTYVNEKHLAHIPEDKLEEPVIVVPLRIWSKKEKNDISCHILIDGNHRAVRRYREGKTVYAYLLTEREAVQACLNRESRHWKGVKAPKKAKAL